MPVRVLVAPEHVVAPEEISGVAADDAFVAAMIAAVTAEIDGPAGWLGRCLGPQTLELRRDCWPSCPLRLPYPPLISVERVSYFDPDGVESEIDAAFWATSGNFLHFKAGWSAPALGDVPSPVKIVYQAGYNGNSPMEDGGTGDIPAQARQAIILSVQHLRSLSKENLFVKADEVEGIGRREYVVSDQASRIVRSAADSLLAGLRVYS